MKKYRLPFSLPSMRKPVLKLPFVSIMSLLPTPYTKLKFGGMIVAMGALAVVAVGFIATFWLTIAGTTHEITWPTSGAEYDLPHEIGTRLSPDADTPMTASQTLKINLGNNTRLDKLHLSRLDLGKRSPESGFKSFQICRCTSGVTGAMVNVGIITIRNSAIPSLDFGNMTVGTVSLAPRTDGHTQGIVLDSQVTDLIVDSARGTGTFVAADSVVDRIVIDLNGDAGAYIGEIIIDDVDASVGSWDWDYVTAGTLVIESNVQIGDGSGIDSASALFGVNGEFKARVVTDNIVDTPLNVR